MDSIEHEWLKDRVYVVFCEQLHKDPEVQSAYLNDLFHWEAEQQNHWFAYILANRKVSGLFAGKRAPKQVKLAEYLERSSEQNTESLVYEILTSPKMNYSWPVKGSEMQIRVKDALIALGDRRSVNHFMRDLLAAGGFYKELSSSVWDLVKR
jgi:hypothetical protein